MGSLCEPYGKGVPFLGAPGNSLELVALLTLLSELRWGGLGFHLQWDMALFCWWGNQGGVKVGLLDMDDVWL